MEQVGCVHMLLAAGVGCARRRPAFRTRSVVGAGSRPPAQLEALCLCHRCGRGDSESGFPVRGLEVEGSLGPYPVEIQGPSRRGGSSAVTGALLLTGCWQGGTQRRRSRPAVPAASAVWAAKQTDPGVAQGSQRFPGLHLPQPPPLPTPSPQ